MSILAVAQPIFQNGSAFLYFRMVLQLAQSCHDLWEARRHTGTMHICLPVHTALYIPVLIPAPYHVYMHIAGAIDVDVFSLVYEAMQVIDDRAWDVSTFSIVAESMELEWPYQEIRDLMQGFWQVATVRFLFRHPDYVGPAGPLDVLEGAHFLHTIGCDFDNPQRLSAEVWGHEFDYWQGWQLLQLLDHVTEDEDE